MQVGGDVIRLLGLNGAGNSTTIKLLMGLIFHTDGERANPRAGHQQRGRQRDIRLPAREPYFYDT